MKAIKTKYFGPGNVRGAKIVATTGEKGQRVAISYPHALDASAAHGLAARTLCIKMDWPGKLIGGGFPDGTMVWVFADCSDTA